MRHAKRMRSFDIGREIDLFLSKTRKIMALCQA